MRTHLVVLEPSDGDSCEVVWTGGPAGHQAQAPKNVHSVLTGLAHFYLKNAKSPHFNL